MALTGNYPASMVSHDSNFTEVELGEDRYIYVNNKQL